MDDAVTVIPAVRWDAFGLELDLDVIEKALGKHLFKADGTIRSVRVGGEGGVLCLEMRVRMGGVPGRLIACVTELQLHRGFLGCRVESLRGPLGIPVPTTVLARLLDRVGGVELDPADDILLLDVRTVIPPGLRVKISDVACRGRVLRLRLAAGEIGMSFPPLRALVVDS